MYSYLNRLNLPGCAWRALKLSELTDPASDIANEEVLSLHQVEPALHCILDPYFQTGSHFQMVKCESELHVPKT